VSVRISAEGWTRGHALVLALSAASCAPLRLVWPAAVVGAGSLLLFLIGELRGAAAMARSAAGGTAAEAPARGLSAANVVTLARLGLVVVLALRLERGSGPLEAGLVLLVFTLDGIDGWIARRTGRESELGARFDMETDALFVLVCALGLYARERLGAYVLVPGVLRYAYVLALAALPRLRREAPRSQLGRYAFALMVLSFAASAWPLSPQHALLALVASLGIVVSFARSVYWSLRPV
jgi:phosphatidylglycerophosphate synthase